MDTSPKKVIGSIEELEAALGGRIVNELDIDSASGYDNSIKDATDLWSTIGFNRGYELEEIGPYILFLLTLERYGYLQNVTSDEDLEREMLSNGISDLPHSKILREIYQRGNLLIDARRHGGKDDFIALVKELVSGGSEAHFPRFFDDLLYRMFSTNSKRGGMFLLTKPVRDLMIGLAGVKEGERVFSPFMGLASFGLNLPKGATFYGQELNDRIYDFALLRGVAHDLDLEFGGAYRFERGDSLLNWPREEIFDCILSAPPMGMRISGYQETISKYRNIVDFVLHEGPNILGERGRAVVLVNTAVLFSKGAEQKTRQTLLDEDLIEAVITLPQGMLASTSIPTAIVVLNRAKANKGYVKIADFTEQSLKLDYNLSRTGILPAIKEFVGAVDHLNYDSDIISVGIDMRLVSAEVIAENDYSFESSRYLLEELEGVQLAELLTPISGEKPSSKLNARLTTIKDLIPDNQENYVIKYQPVDIDLIPTGEYQLPRTTKRIRQPALLLATVGRTLKPTFFEVEPLKNGKYGSFFIAPQVAAFSYDDTLLDRDYLIYQLRSEAVKEQMVAYQKGTAIQRISVKDILRIKIQLPPLQEQEVTMRALKDVNKKMEALRQEREAIDRGLKVAGDKRFATLKHALGRPQQSILAAAKTIRDYLDRPAGEEGARLNRAYAEFFEQERTISDTLQGIINDIDFISQMMDMGENGLRVESYPLQRMSALDVLDAVRNLSTDGLKFKLEVLAEEEEEWAEIFFDLNQDLLRVLLDNLLTNANNHGFKQKAPGNLVQITLAIEKNRLKLEVQNNGTPFAGNITKEQYVQEFRKSNSSSGQGIGGYQVDQIAKYFGGEDWELVANAHAIFPVTFLFFFPVTDDGVIIDNEINTDTDE